MARSGRIPPRDGKATACLPCQTVFEALGIGLPGASVVIALCSMAIALSSLVFSIREARMSQEHDRLLVQPHFVISFYYNKDGVSWVGANDGLGPARIRGFKLLVDGVSQPWTDEFRDALERALKIHPKHSTFSNPIVGTTIKGGDDADLTLISVPPGPDADAPPLPGLRLAKGVEFFAMATTIVCDRSCNRDWGRT
jgi:hypothetical protein